MEDGPGEPKPLELEIDMKTGVFKALGLSILATIATTAHSQENTMHNHTASHIDMRAADGQAKVFEQFLTDAAQLVKKNEPGTKLWFALKASDDELAIFDIFVDEAARSDHFSGAVAGALKRDADVLVEGGWARGVVANIGNSSVLSAKAPTDLYSATTATYIKLQAMPGQGENLAALLSAAGSIVADTEPGTLFWAALQIDEENFAIFDIFADEAGRKAHFAGKVANLLKQKSDVLVKGGWSDGVVKNVRNYQILAIK